MAQNVKTPKIKDPVVGKCSITLCLILLIALVFDGMGAYQFKGIPFPWISSLLIFFCVLLRFSSGKDFAVPPGAVFLVAMGCYALIVMFSQWGNYSMPSLATLSYGPFVILRIYDLAVFIFSFFLSYAIGKHYGGSCIRDMIVRVGFILSIYAIYIYLAQLYGFWEPVRNRMGTGGQDYASEGVLFQYAFHRALGSFREPSHLAQWLITPILLCISSGKKMMVSYVVMLSAFLLTGSLLGFLSLAAGIAALIIVNMKSTKNNVNIIKMTFLAICILFLVEMLGLPIRETLSKRLILIVEGIGATNRSYVYEYLFHNTPPFFGYGLGNSNIKFSEYLGNGLTSSHISLFINTWFSLGIIGIILLIGFFLTLLYAIHARNKKCPQAKAMGYSILVAWLVIYAGHAENLQNLFAFVVGGVLLQNTEVKDDSEKIKKLN